MLAPCYDIVNDRSVNELGHHYLNNQRSGVVTLGFMALTISKVVDNSS